MSVTPLGIQIIDALLQIVIPFVIFVIYLMITLRIFLMKQSALSKNELLILKQAAFVFVAFQASSVVFLIAQSVKTSNVNAFLIKRFVNTMEIIAGAAIPSFFFFTSKEIRRLLSSRVSASSSQGGSNNQIRGMRYIS
ncbi:unnamed protein product [Caenorhabditis nigoni]